MKRARRKDWRSVSIAAWWSERLARCVRELQRVGIRPHVIPKTPSMPALIDAVAQDFESAARA